MRVELEGVRPWRHDLGHCLHATMGVLLGAHGVDPLHVLGAAWGFGYRSGDLRREEYYVPFGAESLLGAMAPHHPVSSRWHRPADAESAWAQVRDVVADGRAVAAAVDNFHLPFRPAYRDVHTNHLLTVYGFDDERDEVLLADPVPPRFQGAVTRAEFAAARSSANPEDHDRDLFFTRNPIGERWLEITVGEELPARDPDHVRSVIAANVSALENDRALAAGGLADDGADLFGGRKGMARFLDAAAARMRTGGDPEVVDETFVVAGTVLAETGVHADWLHAAGQTFGRPELREAARRVERVAHHWSAVRITVANAREDTTAVTDVLETRAAALLADQDRALDLLADCV
ncbi:BtrH N-terminal domain-containing protein [Streptomyces sp. NPDC002701]|uniref:BtrH N-terminal domain-containing protein n=1 Tax=Streptomyces sp. NPDC002701 TaxID=3364661 RepID=UPI0036BC9399